MRPAQEPATRTSNGGPDPALRDLVLKRLDETTKPDDAWPLLVLAALEGQDELAKLLEGSPPQPKQREEPATATTPRVAFLRSISVEGFRGIGPKATLDLAPGPGLTLVVGRNGSGKSSFAEGLELLLTGDNYRWAERARVWRAGWRNLHHPKAALAAEFAIEGETGSCTVAREWADGAELDTATTWAQTHAKPRTGSEALGWQEALESYRPILSYNELGGMLEDGPSKLYDAVAKVLGLDALVDAHTTVQQARTAREKAHKDADQERKAILARLEGVSDERAATVKEALAKKDWSLEAVATVLAGSPSAGEGASAIELLQRLAALPAPEPRAVAEAVRNLREAERRQAAAAQTVAGKSEQLAQLLEHALRFHSAYGHGDCPVCGGEKALDEDWHQTKAREAATLRLLAKEATDARNTAAAAAASLRKLVAVDRALLARTTDIGLGSLAEAVLRHCPDDAADLATAIESHLSQLTAALDELRLAAQAELHSREDAWRPHALALAEWLPIARTARKGAEALPSLKAAEKWMKEAADAIRNERFTPIADHTRSIWDQLKLQSNVSLEGVHLGGTGKARKVELKVTVDGQQGAALGVMSQGELHSLALSLFIPRATLEESPFRFVVIDDPVQSMDPARVDGLARVLETASKHRQVVVFTHDDRLPESLRRLDIPATVIEVTRREASQVALRLSKDPVSRYIEDAMALARTDNLPPEVARRVIPGLCREAMEAACMEAIRRRRIGRGEPHAEVEALLTGLSGSKSLAALALFDDEKRAGDVLPHLNKKTKEAADTFRAVNEGSHEALPGAMSDLVRSAEKLVGWMQRLP